MGWGKWVAVAAGGGLSVAVAVSVDLGRTYYAAARGDRCELVELWVLPDACHGSKCSSIGDGSLDCLPKETEFYFFGIIFQAKSCDCS